MKKFFQIFGILAFIVFIFVLLAGFAGFIFLKTFDIKKYKPQIIAAATNALGRAVDFKDIDLAVSLEKGVRVHLTDFSIAENPDFGADSFVTVKEADAGVDLLAFIMSRQISVPSVWIRSPQITLIRNSSNVWNAQTLKAKAQSESSSDSVAPVAAIPAIFINSFRVENAQVTLLDQTVSPALKLAVSQLTLDIKQFSLANPFDVSLEAAVLSGQKDLNLAGKIQLNLANGQVYLTDMDVALDLGQLPLEKLKALPQLSAMALPRILEGKVKLNIHKAQITPKGVENFNANISLSNGRFVEDEIVPGVSLEARRLDFSLENFSLDNTTESKMTVSAALYQDQTNVELSAKVLVDLKKTQVKITDAEFSTDLALWPLAKVKSQIVLLKNIALPENLSGKFKILIKESILGAAGLQTLLLDAKWQDGAIVLKDFIPGASLALAKTDMEIGNFSFGKQFSLSLKSAYLSETQNISFAGAVTFDPKSQAISINNGLAEVNTNSFDLERFKASGFLPSGLPFPQTLAGVFQAQIADLSVSPKGLGEMKVDLKWQNGKVIFTDVVPGISMAAYQINFKVMDIVALNKPFSVETTLGYESDDPNLFFKGQVLLDLSAQKVNITDATLKTDFSKVPLEQIKAKISCLKAVQLPEKIKGELLVTIANASVGGGGLITLAGDVSLNSGEVKLKELAVPIIVAQANVKLTENKISADELTVNIGKGQIISKIDVENYLKEQQFNLTSQIKGLEISQLLDQSKAPVKVSGLVFGNLKAKGQASDIKSIAGDGNFEVKQAQLKDLNVLKTVLEKISFIPHLASDMETKLPEKYQAKLKSNDTSVNKVTGAFTLADGHIVLDPISVEADEFVLNGKSQADFDQSYTFDGAFKITSELSAIMGQSSEELTYLYDTDNNISLPVHISGKGSQMPAISIVQSALDITKNAARNEGKKELGKILDKALGIPRDSQNQPQNQDPSLQHQESPGAQIIGGILDKVFK